jgi:hypothetical protein
MQSTGINNIKCPNCQYEFDPGEALTKHAEDHLRQEFEQKQALKDAEYKKKEQELAANQAVLEQQKQDFNRQLQEQMAKARENITLEVRKDLQEKQGAYLKLMEEEKKVLFEEKLKREAEAREKEMELIKLKDAVANQRQAIELELMQKFQADKGQLEENIRKSEQERVNMMLAEKEKQLDDQKKLIAEMQRKAEQGSMQMQGEVLELALEDLLKEAFPFDVIEEVGKGVRGADVIQTVRNKYSHECGKIIYETKRTKNFEHGWIEKLKHDMVGQKASVAVLVTEAYPKELDRFGIIDGVWICKFADIKPLVMLLRDTMEKIYTANSAQENKGEKMQLLYSYLTGNEFRLQIEAIVEGFKAMEDGLSSEKKAMQRIWKEREKQLEKVLTNTIDFYGSVRGIAGSSVPEIKMLELGNDDKLLEE